MNTARDTASAGDGGSFDPQQAAALLDQTTHQARRNLAPSPPWLLATRAVADIKRVAFGRLRLHRIEAGTLKHNRSSQRVLERNGFERFGLAPNYLQIDGRWQDHVLFQVVNEP